MRIVFQNKVRQWVAYVVLILSSVSATAAVKQSQVSLFDSERNRPLVVTVWHPEESNGCAKSVVCLPAVTNDAPIILSHGAMGGALNYNWIGYQLAAQGYVVIGLNHFGESWFYGPANVREEAALELWERAYDVSFAIDQLSSNENQKNSDQSLFNRSLNWQNVSVVGHSSGGSTALVVAGARYQPDLAIEYCASAKGKSDRSCGYLKGKELPPAEAKQLTYDFKDERIQRLVLLDPAIGHMTTKQSLAGIDLPVLLVGASNNDFLNYKQHGEFYAKHLPNAKVKPLLGDEGHFVFLDTCSHNHMALDVPLCKDKPSVNREKTHAEVGAQMVEFLKATLK